MMAHTATKTARTGSRRLSSAARGFTILEVLIGTLVVTIGLLGIFGMQSLAITANRSAYDMRVASELADLTLERMSRDAIAWTDAANWPANTALERVMDSAGSWKRPVVAISGDEDPPVNDLGVTPADSTAGDAAIFIGGRNSRYCIESRANWVRAPRLVRLEVLVSWPRTTVGERLLGGTCSNLDGVDAATRLRHFHSVQASSMVASNPVLR